MSIHHIDEHSHNQRADNYLAKQFKVPRALLYRLIRTGQIRVNQQKITFAYKLQAGDIVSIYTTIDHHIPKEHQDAACKQALSRLHCLYEDPYFIAVNKPSGLACHGGSHISAGLIESLRNKEPGQYFELVHRLDRSTSGIVLVAKKRAVLTALQKQFSERRVKKTYLALSHGLCKQKQGLLSFPLIVNHQEGGTRTVSINHTHGKPSETFIQRIACHDEASFIRAYPYTGRTHQIRVHLSHIGCPIIGDQRYGDFKKEKKRPAKRLFLHAYHIKLQHPVTEEPCLITSPIPKDFFYGLNDFKIVNDTQFFQNNSLLVEDFS